MIYGKRTGTRCTQQSMGRVSFLSSFISLGPGKQNFLSVPYICTCEECINNNFTKCVSQLWTEQALSAYDLINKVTRQAGVLKESDTSISDNPIADLILPGSICAIAADSLTEYF